MQHYRLHERIFVLLLAVALAGAGCDLFGDERDESSGKLFGDGGYFGSRVALHGDRALVGARFDGNGAVFAFSRNEGDWEQAAKLRGDALAGDEYHFAWSFAVGAQRAAIGAIGEAQGPGGGNAKPGRVLLYEGRDGVWNQRAQFTSSEAENQDSFGGAMAIDGDHLLVGAHRESFEGSTAGAAYLYECGSGKCTETAKFVPDGLAPLDFFGTAVALDDGRALIGADSKDEVGEESGVAYVFEHAGGRWRETAKLLPKEKDVFEEAEGFGEFVALAGSRAVVSLTGETVDGHPSAGAVYVFERSGGGGAWRQAARLVAPEPVAGDFFGTRVDASGDYVIAGASLADRGRGAAYVYHHRDDGTWKLQTKLQPEEAGRNHFFGEDVAIDGRFAIVGMPGENSEAGTAYVYERQGENWQRYGTE